MKPKIYLIAAADEKLGIGKNGKMPWDFKKDLASFQRTTTKTEKLTRENMVIMGRTTWESLPKEHRPLKGRRNVVLTRDKAFQAEGAYVFHSIDAAIAAIDPDVIESIFIMGGGSVYTEAIKRRDIEGIYLTQIRNQYDCDTFFPKIPNRFHAVKLGKKEENDVHLDFMLYKK